MYNKLLGQEPPEFCAHSAAHCKVLRLASAEVWPCFVCPAGLLGFGMTTCMLMFVTTSWSPAVSGVPGPGLRLSLLLSARPLPRHPVRPLSLLCQRTLLPHIPVLGNYKSNVSTLLNGTDGVCVCALMCHVRRALRPSSSAMPSSTVDWRSYSLASLRYVLSLPLSLCTHLCTTLGSRAHRCANTAPYAYTHTQLQDTLSP